MTSTPNFKKHAALVDRMASTLGIDLEQKAMEGQIDFEQISDAVMACTGCSNPEECTHWLDAQEGKAGTTPDICRNAKIFARLKAGKHA
ncbi:hypothetical protein FDP25_12435 [Roseovarius sp. A21]|uniref:DUF6455 domain-containing protein n=1 Tax=Roseovarius bejariae TaxID=2576383 RepID=A0A844CLN8_9RHOB|nr:DUF6455 family protein [Roseovarius bejariae]MRU16241.1 hypothetical protein [Roseovarius bejariae]